MGVIISYVVALIMNTAGITNPDAVSYTHLVHGCRQLVS